MQPKREILWKPMEKQAKFLSCPAFECGYGGAKAGGKSDAMANAPLVGIATGVSGYRALLLRRRFTDLEKSLIVRCAELYRGRARWDGQKKRWTFPNQCFVEFGHCQNESDVNNYDSAQYAFIGIEQAEQFTEEMYLHFLSIARTTNPQIRPKMRLTFNPGGVGHTWLVNRFWIGDATHPVQDENGQYKMYPVSEKVLMPDGKEETMTYYRSFIPATVFDNEHIMKNDRIYLAQLMALPEPQRSAYLYGRFDLFEGQFFKEWDEKVHVVEPFDIPDSWVRNISFDWGYGGGKTAMYWWAQDPKTRTWYAYRELYVSGLSDVDVAKEMDLMTGNEKIECIFYPWDLDNKQPTANFISMQERMDDATGRKYYWKKANKERIQGWMAVRYMLKIRPDLGPMMKVFTNCKNLIRTLPKQVFSETNSEDLDTDGDDHCVDGVRYFAGSFIPLDDLISEVKSDRRIDVGGAYLIPEHKEKDKIVPKQLVMKKESAMAFNWMSDY